jgi:hypothetical protein
MIQVRSAIANTINVSPSYLSLPTGAEETTSTLTFVNTGNRPCAYQLGHTPAVSVDTANAWYGKEEMLKIAASLMFTTNTGSREIQVLYIQPGETVNIKAVVTTSDKLRSAPLFYRWGHCLSRFLLASTFFAAHERACLNYSLHLRHMLNLFRCTSACTLQHAWNSSCYLWLQVWSLL